jgi:hypothetical protein
VAHVYILPIYSLFQSHTLFSINGKLPAKVLQGEITIIWSLPIFRWIVYYGIIDIAHIQLLLTNGTYHKTEIGVLVCFGLDSPFEYHVDHCFVEYS